MARIQIDFFSQCLMRTVTIDAVVPVDPFPEPGKEEREQKPFQTLYLLHGFHGYCADWLTETNIKALAERRNLAVIMPSGDNKYYVDNAVTGEKYGEFIGKELVSVTRKLFRLSDKREDTFIAGLSMGGYGALRNGLKYHDTFSRIAGLSSGLILDWVYESTDQHPDITRRRSYYETLFGNLDCLKGSDMDYKAQIGQLKEERADIPEIYMVCGTEDFLLEENRDYAEFLKNQKVSHVYEEYPGCHEWSFWAEHIKNVLDWLPLDKDR